ncbi:unnamed protein product [Ilex paraguariensis]|uniref:Uncharacterized protein n=1 Tax=Ilex paraguariensis TaxID=185542 RepID=A0ABC8TNN6_9AQUA
MSSVASASKLLVTGFMRPYSVASLSKICWIFGAVSARATEEQHVALLFLLLCLILADAFVILATANETVHAMVEPDMAYSSNPPVPSPSSTGKLVTAEAPVIRKLGKHQQRIVKPFAAAPNLSPSEAPQSEENLQSANEVSSSGGQEIQLKKLQHHPIDKSIAGGGVILGGLAATFLVAVFRYIRATGTGRKNAEPSA